MTTVKRIAFLLMAMLLLAHGLATADSHPPIMPGSIAELEAAISHDPVAMHAARGGHQCREAGCTIAASHGQCAIMPMVLPDLPAVRPFAIVACFAPPVEHSLAMLFFAPPVPPPKSPVFETTGAFVA